ncbi:MAG: type II asparaginase [Pseudomonadota bacterium]
MKPTIAVLSTGGTIAGKADSSTDKSYTSAKLDVKGLLLAVPPLEQLADIEARQIANVGSQDMQDNIWLELAARINALLQRDSIEGIVVIHGTDTIEETAYFLNLVISSDKPVVLTAAMRPSTALSADGPLNIYNAVAVAADSDARGRGVLVVVNDDIHGARGMTKTSTTDVQTFVSAERGLVGASLYGKNRYYRSPYRTHTSASEFRTQGISELPKVQIIYMHAGVSAELIEAAVASHAQGIVTAGVGNGNMSAATLSAVKKAIGEGVVVVRSTRVTNGTVDRNIEINDDDLGTVASGELNPAQSRVLLKLALLKTRNVEHVQRLFDRY